MIRSNSVRMMFANTGPKEPSIVERTRLQRPRKRCQQTLKFLL